MFKHIKTLKHGTDLQIMHSTKSGKKTLTKANNALKSICEELKINPEKITLKSLEHINEDKKEFSFTATIGHEGKPDTIIKVWKDDEGNWHPKIIQIAS